MILKSHEKNDFILVNMSLQEIEKKLQHTNSFFRVSRTSLVCISAIKSILKNTQYTVVLSNRKKYLSLEGDTKHLLNLLKKPTKPRFSFYIDVCFSIFVSTCQQKLH